MWRSTASHSSDSPGFSSSRLLGKAIQRIDLFDAMLFRDAEGRGERERTVVFDEERLAIVRDRLGDVLFSTITRETIRLPSQA